MAKKVPTIGSRSDGTSYPDPSLAGNVAPGNDSLGGGEHNFNAFNAVEVPEVFNASPATKKSYSWNKGANGNAT